jgi:tetratricopeptide (TPR) repeat protein
VVNARGPAHTHRHPDNARRSCSHHLQLPLRLRELPGPTRYRPRSPARYPTCPAEATNYARLSALDPDHRAQWLDAAIERNPTNSLYWIERAVTAEIAGNPPAAEASLLEAARRDHLYVPRWALAAFYYRQQDKAKFQTSARQALEMSWGDALPLFQMASKLGMSLDDIRRTMLPDRAPVLAAFLSECVRLKDLDEAFRVARRLIEIGDKDVNRTTALAAVDTLFEAGRTDPAVQLWNQAAAAHWFPHPAIGPPVTNPEFSLEFLPAGFDWRPFAQDGVVYWRLGNSRGLQFEFSGRQPENCTLLKLNLPLDPRKSYKLNTKASGFNLGSGLKWHLGTQEWDAFTPEESIQTVASPTQLTLTYNRALGTKRIEGVLTLYRVEVTQ